MLPILLCSIIALAIIIERLWALQHNKVLPQNLLENTVQLATHTKLNEAQLTQLKNSSPLGKILATALINRHQTSEVLNQKIEDVGRHIAHDLQHFLNTLGTIAAITPLLGLLGTVVGMIDVFATITQSGASDASELARGISQALLTTAAGLSVAIPSLIFYRFLQNKIRSLVVDIEQQSILLIELLQTPAKSKTAK